jgi:alpha,alpha-trehalase
LITADTFVALFVGLATPMQARKMREVLPLLEGNGGVISSDRNSGKQWDAPYGWAPQNYFAIEGLSKYGFAGDAKRLAQKWVDSIDRIYLQTGKIFEKIDAVTGDLPVEDGGKYPTQEGFLWTNGVYAWAITDILGFELIKTH